MGRLRMNSTVIFDIDGTLADISGHTIVLDKNPANWPEFDVSVYPPNKIVAQLARDMFLLDYRVVLFTARFERYRQATEEWMEKHNIFFHELYMREDGDYRPDQKVKKEFLEIVGKDRVRFIVEDRTEVVKMWRKLGVTCFQNDFN
jgi:hypothetical protein